MAQETAKETTTNESVQDSNVQEAQTDNQTTEGKSESTPSVDELMAQLAQERAEKQRLQNKYNQASTEAAETKKALRARQSAEEREAAEKEEAQRLADEERESIKQELNHMKAVAAYKNIPEEDTIELLIGAVSDADHSAIATIIENEKQKAVKKAQAEWQKSRPNANAGTGDAKQITKEQFDRMSISEKSKLYREDRAEYDRLKG